MNQGILIPSENERESMSIKMCLRAVALVLPVALLMILSGCASNTLEPSTGPITFVNVDGSPLATQPTSLAAGSTAYFMVDVGNDPQLLGANWSISCTNEPAPGTPLPPGETVDESCGFFTPVHTLGGPVPTYASSAASYITLYTAPTTVPSNGIVTLYAGSTVDPSRSSSVALTITGLAISIALSPVPPSTLTVNGTASLTAILSNDTASGGASWTVSCGSMGTDACGSLSATDTASGVATTYTAPAAVPVGGIVTVRATSVTDPTKSASATITIQP